jgi:hypothetical protein
MLVANIGIPMVCVTVPLMLLALLPIALVEAITFRSLLNVNLSRAWRGALRANLWSTLLGIPVVWLLMVILQVSIGGERAWGIETPQKRFDAVTLQAPWLIPYRGQDGWMVPAASLVLLTPFYLASVFVEYLVLRTYWAKESPRGRLLGGVALANLLSYLLLGSYHGIRLYYAMNDIEF